MAKAAALSAVEAAKLGDRLRKLIGIIGTVGGAVGSLPGGLASFLDNFDITKVGAFLEAFKLIGAAPDTKTKVLAALEAAKQFTLITTSTVDDSLVKAITNIIGNGAILDFIVGMIGKMEAASRAGTMSVLSDADLKAGAPASAKAFDIGLLVTIARTIWSIIQLFRKPAAA